MSYSKFFVLSALFATLSLVSVAHAEGDQPIQVNLPECVEDDTHPEYGYQLNTPCLGSVIKQQAKQPDSNFRIETYECYDPVNKRAIVGDKRSCFHIWQKPIDFNKHLMD